MKKDKGLVLTVEKESGEIIKIPCKGKAFVMKKLKEINKTVSLASLERHIRELTTEIARIKKLPREDAKRKKGGLK